MVNAFLSGDCALIIRQKWTHAVHLGRLFVFIVCVCLRMDAIHARVLHISYQYLFFQKSIRRVHETNAAIQHKAKARVSKHMEKILQEKQQRRLVYSACLLVHSAVHSVDGGSSITAMHASVQGVFLRFEV